MRSPPPPDPPVDLLRAALPAEPRPELAAAALRPFLVDHAVQALAAGRARPQAAAPAMAAWFRRTRRLGSRDRARVQELALAAVRHEAILRRAGADDDRALVEAAGRLLGGERFRDLPPATPAADLATALSLPEALAAEWLAALGPAEAAAFAAVQATRAPVYLRVNVARTTPEAAAALLPVGAVLHPPWGLELRERLDLATTRAYTEGLVEVQDLSSQRLVAAIADHLALDGARALDLCAGAGGKSLALAALGARVDATDPRPAALRELERRAARGGHAVRVGAPGRGYALVLVDAPCSGTGRLRREPTLRWGLDPDRHLAAQRALLDEAAPRVAPGGLLVYATCSLLAREDHVPEPAGFDLLEAATCWPHRQPGDGFSWRIWRRASGPGR